MISISTLTIAWGAVCGRKTFFCFSLILLCRFHSALFFFFFDSLKKNQTSLMGQILLVRPSLLVLPIFQKMERKETTLNTLTIQGDFLASELFMFPIAASLNKNRDFLAGFSSSSFLSKGSGFELWWLFYGKRASFYFAATASSCSSMKENLSFYHQDLYVTRWFLTKLLSPQFSYYKSTRFRPRF